MGERVAERHEFLPSECLPDPKISMFTWFTSHQVWRNNLHGRFLIMPRQKMKFEILRHVTLLTYPRGNKPDIVSIAVAGFYYSGSGDDVVCYCCGLVIRRLRETDEPISMHQQISARCDFFERNRDVNKRFFPPKPIEEHYIGHFEQGDLHAQEETQNHLSVQPEPQQRHDVNTQVQQEEPIRRNQERHAEPLDMPNIVIRANNRQNGEDMTAAYAEALHVHLRDILPNFSSENVTTAPINQNSSERSIEQVGTLNDGTVQNSEHHFEQVDTCTRNESSVSDSEHQSEQVDTRNDSLVPESEHQSEQVDTRNDSLVPESEHQIIQHRYSSNADNSYRQENISVPSIQIETANKQEKYAQNFISFRNNILPNFMDMTFRKRNFTSIPTQFPNTNNLEEEVARFFNVDRYKARLATFKNWPGDNPMAPEHLADAGFRYTGKNDQVCCDTCGKVLQEWKNDDDPWLEHVRHSFDCPYVLQEYGRRLPMAVKQNNEADIKYYKEIFRNRRAGLYVCSRSLKAVSPISVAQTSAHHEESEQGWNLQCCICSEHDDFIRPLSCGHVICKACMAEDTCPECSRNNKPE